MAELSISQTVEKHGVFFSAASLPTHLERVDNKRGAGGAKSSLQEKITFMTT